MKFGTSSRFSSGFVARWLGWFCAGLGVVLMGGAWLGACAPKPRSQAPLRQGLFGQFKTYRLPPPEACDSLYRTQEERDNCLRRNRTRIVEPLKAQVLVTRIDSERGQRVTLQNDGSYRIELAPGYYTVCLGKSCSDAIEVRMNTFVAYGAEYPRANIEAILKGDPDTAEATP